jgi:glutamate--cysteine ligase
MENHTKTANFGRKPNFSLTLEKKEITLKDWALDLMKGILQVAYSIDQEKNCSGYVRAVEAQIELIKDPERTPSARLLSELNDSGLSFSEYGLMLSKERKDYFSSLMSLDASKNNLFRTEASASLQRQSDMESSDELSFDEYLENYFKS